jgi:SAM-dependent methyltransferase
VTSQPSLCAAMIAALRLDGTHQVLEIGADYGYQTALLARLAARVVSVEIWPDLAERAQRNLAAQGIGNVVVLVGDGTEGAPGHAPFDAVVVSAAFPRVPPPLAAQLRTGGRARPARVTLRPFTITLSASARNSLPHPTPLRGARLSPATRRVAWLGEEQQLMRPPGRFPGCGASRFGHRAALKPAREHFDRLGERVHPGLEPTQPFKRRRSRI